MADQEFKLQVPKEDIVKKESDALSKMAGASPLQDIIGRSGKARSTKDIMGLRSEAAGQELGALEAEREAAIQKPIEEARIKGEYMQKEAEQYKGLYDTYQQKLQKTEIPDFKPTQENLMSLSAMAGLIAVVGNVLGKTGGMSGLSAINSMTGMMKGYQQGRKDLYDREKAQFDKDMAKLKAEQEKLMREFEMGYKKIPYNLAEAKADMETALAKSGSDFLKATYNRQGATLTRQRIDEIGKDIKHSEDIATKIGIAQSKGAGGILKPSAKIGEGYVSLGILSSDLKGLSEDLKNTELQKQIRDYRIESFLTEEGKVLNQLLTQKLPPELQQFLNKVRDIRNNYYLDISGKAVTGNEALRNYGTVPQPGDAPEEIANKIATMGKRVNSKINTYQMLYGLPQLPDQAIAAGTKTNLVPNESYETDQSTPVISTKEQYDKLPSGVEYFEIDSAGNKVKFRKP